MSSPWSATPVSGSPLPNPVGWGNLPAANALPVSVGWTPFAVPPPVGANATFNVVLTAGAGTLGLVASASTAVVASLSAGAFVGVSTGASIAATVGVSSVGQVGLLVAASTTAVSAGLSAVGAYGFTGTDSGLAISAAASATGLLDQTRALPVQIANPMVGPMALRNKLRSMKRPQVFTNIITPGFVATAGAGGTSGTTLSASQTFGPNTAILVAVVYSGTTQTISSVVCGSTTLTVLKSFNYAGAASYIALYGSLATGTGSSQTVTVTFGNALSSASPGVFSAASYQGVNSFGTALTNSGSGTTATVSSVVSQVGHLAFCTVGVQPGSAITFSGWGTATQRFLNTGGSAPPFVENVGADAPGAATVNFSTTLSSSTSWGAIGIGLL